MRHSPGLYSSYFVALILVVTNSCVVNVWAGNFSTSCTEAELVGETTFSATCDTLVSDVSSPATIDLANCLTNDNGTLKAGSGFPGPNGTCQAINYDASDIVLKAVCPNSNSQLLSVVQIDLDTILSNNNGTLTCS
ncbi:hypothetical protein DFH07DRAFT_963301 [Mycena maculata]|uniref:Cyanovirin-N domain-containing protein n=1 Tax=Mycena maculata TaxID=230809 RepID=A0AAD7N5R9_9AGAR|nr:hypothetical protein DFH07DRAFT_963301 [Mycena maculata]